MGVVNQHRVYASGNPSVIRLPVNAVTDVARLPVLGWGVLGKWYALRCFLLAAKTLKKGPKAPLFCPVKDARSHR